MTAWWEIPLTVLEAANPLQTWDNSVPSQSGPAVREHPGPDTEGVASMPDQPISGGHIPAADVLKAAADHQAGQPLGAIARANWRHWGYQSPQSAADALRQEMRAIGARARTYSLKTLVCEGCGKTLTGRFPPSQRYCSRRCRWPTRIIERDGQYLIPLYNRLGEIVAETLIDRTDVPLADHRWHLARSGYPASRIRRDGKSQVVLLHRLILNLIAGDRRAADHINGDRLDNRRSNLRIVTPGENAQNKPKAPGSSRYRGVAWSRASGKWMAYGSVQGKRHHLGVFVSEDEAGEVARQWRAAHMTHVNEKRHA